jgi:hypothetical protein
MRDEPSWTASAALDLDVVAAVELAVLEEPPEAPVPVAEVPEPAPKYSYQQVFAKCGLGGRTCSCSRCGGAGAGTRWGAARGCWSGSCTSTSTIIADATFNAGLFSCQLNGREVMTRYNNVPDS